VFEVSGKTSKALGAIDMAIHTCGGTWTGNQLCTTEICNSYAPCANPIETWTGCVLWTGEHNWHDDSDFYAVVWDDAAGQTREIEYASTRGWTYHNSAVIDASEEFQAKAAAYLGRIRAENEALRRAQEAKTPMVGKEVRSLTTRGKNKGVVGMVRRIQPDQYNRSRWASNVAAIEIAGEDKYRYISVDRLEVINPEQYLTTS
jgi:hypothetical protein